MNFFRFLMLLIPSMILQVPDNHCQSLNLPNNPLVDSLRHDFDSLKQLQTDNAKKNLNTSIISQMEVLLKAPESFSLSLDSLKFIGKVTSPDNAFRILNWNLAYDDFSYEYFTFMQLNPQGKFGYKVFRIKGNHMKIDPSIENKQFDKDSWYGALIYKILFNKHKRQNYYTLLAIDQNNMMSHFKFIDVITLNDKGEPVFGKPIFKTSKKVSSRVVFEYSAQVVMGLKYNERVKMIVFDHLSPIRPELAGDYKFYGPDFSYDGFEFKDGFWIYRPDLKLSNEPPSVKPQDK